MKYFSHDELINRHKYLIENLVTLELNGKVGFLDPNTVSLSSELLEKCTHVQEEFRIRGKQIVAGDLINSAIPKSMMEAYPRLHAINQLATTKKPHLIKFGKKEYLEKYSFKVSLASSFSDSSLNVAQMDDEMKAVFQVSPDKLKITDSQGNIIKPISMINFTHEIEKDYYIFCSSGEFDIRLFGNFEADSCLFIYDSQKFADELITELRSYIDIEEYAYQMVEYIDPIQNNMQYRKPIIPFYKHMKYLYQKEYRHVFLPTENSNKPKDIFITLSSAKDYSELVLL